MQKHGWRVIQNILTSENSDANSILVIWRGRHDMETISALFTICEGNPSDMNAGRGLLMLVSATFWISSQLWFVGDLNVMAFKWNTFYILVCLVWLNKPS